MYITAVPNRGSTPTVLLRESYREGGKVKNRTLANLTTWPSEVVEAMRAALKGGRTVPADDIEIIASRDHGAAALVLGLINDLGLPKLIAPRASRQRSMVLGMIAARILCPSTKHLLQLRHRAALPAGGGRRGLRGQHRRQHHSPGADREGEDALLEGEA